VKINDISIEDGVPAELFKVTGVREYRYQEGGRLLLPFKVGESCRVGSYFSRSYSLYDYWTTTIVTAITRIECYKGSSCSTDITFETLNSTYKICLGFDITETGEEIEGIEIKDV